MAGTNAGAIVPFVKSEPGRSTSEAALEAEPGSEPPNQSADPSPSEPEVEAGERAKLLDKEFMCPICMQIIKDAFLTACGHSFCYMCIVTHLRDKNDCPWCGRYLANNHIFPNFALDKLLKKMSCRRFEKHSTPFDSLFQALRQGCEVTVKELDSLLSLLAERKRKMVQHEAETNLQILLEFMYCLRKQKLEQLNEIKNDLQCIKEDIKAVKRQRIDFLCKKNRYSVRPRMVTDDSATATVCPSVSRQIVNVAPSGCSMQDQMTSRNLQHRKDDAIPPDSELEHLSQSGSAMARKRQIHAQFNDLQECYLQKRRDWAKQACRQEERGTIAASRTGYHPGLEDFKTVLTNFSRYSQLRVIAELRHGDLFHSPNIISSIEFDRDDELFATAGVSKRIKVFEFNFVVNEPTEAHCPIVEMATRSKLICLSWNKYTKNHIASSDYEGIVTVWDVTTQQSVMEYEEHEKRAWSVDFSRTNPSMLVSGSDDCKVKVWCTKQEESVINIGMRANICSVQFNPGSSTHVAVGSADHHIHYYDLRNASQPLHMFSGHKKAVSYVKFMSNNEIASASTDSTLRLWDVKENLLLRTYRGHTNEKYFIGLSVNSDYLACGSETNEVFAYHKAISRPVVKHRFSLSEVDEPEEDVGSCFISTACWKNDGPTMMAANNQGTIKVLGLAA
ncbi:hypothetical protein Nepgr_017612 [Nepenthes gracilis]|uniref:RING-type domain-containing protein n=1 Tax=Nepenthes gracilis TaxID=150966 RepID=A0AAD3SSY0_NEPGR|nr:hypothetical protein Nepgr_017612 [Nepenthes gracilis]